MHDGPMSSRKVAIMWRGNRLTALFFGVLCGSLSAQALCQEAPKLRTIERVRKAEGGVDESKGASERNDIIPVASERAAKANGASVKVDGGVLPRSDIALPKPLSVSAEAKKKLAQSVESAMRAKALKQTTIGMVVIDLDSGEVVYSKNADKRLKPASNTKLVTTAAALAILGPEYQFESALLKRGKVENGVLKGDLQLYIDHDFTWSTRFYATGDTPLVGLISQLKAAGIQKITGNVIVSGYVVYGGMATNTLSVSGHLQRAANQFGALLRKNKISYGALSVKQNAKKEGNSVAVWRSPVLSQAIVPLNRVSHNEYADMLLLAIGAHKSGKSTNEAGAKAELAWLKSIGLDTKGIQFFDGSGLSHDNRVSASFLTHLTSWVLRESTFAREWAASLSISGYDGTYGGRLATADGKGRVYAKSGTLRDVISGSGFLINKYDGHTYAFSVLVNGSRNRKLTRQAIDRMVMPFLGDFLGVRKPGVPAFVSYRKESDSRVVARWSAVPNALGYRVYQSTDGNRWSVAAETKDTVLIMPDEARHLRLTAVSAGGAESEPSLIYSYRPGEKSMAIVEMAQCRSDEAMRPASHRVAHEVPLARFIGESWGVFTTSQSIDGAQGALLHSTSCAGKVAWKTDVVQKAMDVDIPIIVNVVDAHLSAQVQGECAPDAGKLLGCYGEPVVTKDRRIGVKKDNTRLRKAAGTGSSRPSSVSVWKGAESTLEMGGMTVSTHQKAPSGRDVHIVGFDIQGLDSQKTLDAAWKSLGL